MKKEKTETKEKKKLRSHTLALIISAAAVLTLLAAAYGAGVYYFRDRFPFGVSYRGEDVSLRYADAIGEIDEAAAGARTITVTGRGGAQREYSLSDWLGYTEEGREPEGGWLPSPWAWPLSLRRAMELPADIRQDYDDTKLDALLEDIEAIHADAPAAPENAYVYRVGYHYFIEPETEGNALRINTLRSAVRGAVRDYIYTDEESLELDLEALDAYRPPLVRSDNAALLLERDNLDLIRGQTVTIDLTGAQDVLDAERIMDFYLRDEEGRLTSIDADLVYAYVSGLKETYDTYERGTPFVNAYGNVITVGSWRDTYGFRMDLDATYASLMDMLTGHISGTLCPVWEKQALARSEIGSDIGGTYIEVSVSNQHLWAYRDGECIVSTDVVTGNLGNHDTPPGEYYILYAQQGATLVGDDYESYVNFWMPITMSGIGLHDASWRGSYGGGIYRGNGSHGCINMPYWAASELYWNYSAGTPVVVW